MCTLIDTMGEGVIRVKDRVEQSGRMISYRYARSNAQLAKSVIFSFLYFDYE